MDIFDVPFFSRGAFPARRRVRKPRRSFPPSPFCWSPFFLSMTKRKREASPPFLFGPKGSPPFPFSLARPKRGERAGRSQFPLPSPSTPSLFPFSLPPLVQPGGKDFAATFAPLFPFLPLPFVWTGVDFFFPPRLSGTEEKKERPETATLSPCHSLDVGAPF